MDEELVRELTNALNDLDRVECTWPNLLQRALAEIRRLDALVPKDGNTHGETYGRRSGGVKERLF